MIPLLLGSILCLQDQDTVHIQLPGKSGSLIMRGEIEDYTGVEIRIRTNSTNPIRTYPSADIIRVDSFQLPEHHEGVSLLASGKPTEAMLALSTALEQEDRRWVRREILSEMVRVSLYLGDYETAGERFLRIVESDETTRHFALIPLCWAPGDRSPGLVSRAGKWMASQSPIAQILGASWLADHPKNGPVAREVLKELSRSTQQMVQHLAVAQTWRFRLEEADLPQSELERWNARIERIPDELRGGPRYLLGRAYLRHSEYERASLAFLWLPLETPTDRLLSSRSLLEAARALERSGDMVGYETLRSELVDRFPETTFAKEVATTPSP